MFDGKHFMKKVTVLALSVALIAVSFSVDILAVSRTATVETVVQIQPTGVLVGTNDPVINLGSFYKLDLNPSTITMNGNGIVTTSPNLIQAAAGRQGSYLFRDFANTQYQFNSWPVWSGVTTPENSVTSATMVYSRHEGGQGSPGSLNSNWRAFSVPLRMFYGVTLNLAGDILPDTYTTTFDPRVVRNNGHPLPPGSTLDPISVSFTIRALLRVTEITPLNFGVIATRATPTNVIMSPNGTRTGSAVLLHRMPMPTAAEVNVSGTPLWSFSVILPDSVSLVGPGNILTATNFTTSHGLTGLSTDETGNFNFTIGGELLVPAENAAAVYGTYSGAMVVTINY